MNARQEQITVPLTLHVLILQDHILVLVMMDILEMDVQVRISPTLPVLIRLHVHAMMDIVEMDYRLHVSIISADVAAVPGKST